MNKNKPTIAAFSAIVNLLRKTFASPANTIGAGSLPVSQKTGIHPAAAAALFPLKDTENLTDRKNIPDKFSSESPHIAMNDQGMQSTEPINAENPAISADAVRLQHTEDQMNTVFQNAPDAIIVINSGGVITKWNPAAERIFGWTECEVKGKTLEQVIIPADYRKRHKDGLRRFQETGVATVLNRTIEVPAIRRDEAVIQVELTISAVKLVERTPLAEDQHIFIAFIRDITARKKVEADVGRLNETLEQRVSERTAALHESEKKYRQLFERNPIAVFVFDLSTFRFIDVNDAAVRQYGWSREEFLSMTALNIRPPDEIERFLSVDRNQAHGLRNIGVWKHVKKNGEVIYAEVTAYNISYDGQTARLSLATDVTEKIHAEQALRASESRFRKIFDSRMIGIFFWDKDGNINEANDFFLEQIRYSRQDLIDGKIRWTDITPPEYLHLDYAALQQIKVKGACDPFEKEYIRKDGTRFSVLVGAARLEETSPDKGVAFIMDISDRKNMQQEIVQLNKDLEKRVLTRTEELQLANKELESFSYSVSHDLRTPLRAIHGYSQVVIEEYESSLDPEGKRLLNLVQHYAKRMGQLVDDLLEFSRVGKRDLSLVQSNMNSIVTDVLWEFNLNCDAKYRIDVHPLGEAMVDPSFVKLVFRNLISNAIKYSSKVKNPKVEIGRIQQGSEWIYFVKDNGAGFDMQYYHKLFGVFQRLHGDDEFDGTGIGLAISERVVKKHGGRIWAEGSPGKGAVFYLTLTPPVQNKTDE